MSMHERYRGSFLDAKSVAWTCVISQEADADYPSVGDLDMPRSEKALTIEWLKEDKEKSICGSVATLRVYSPGDRTYEDLYSIKPGQIRLCVYRRDALWWSGCLDPEFYEEPYATEKGYLVVLTFSDFGILGRLSFGLTEGTPTVLEAVEAAANSAKLVYSGIDYSLVSTTLAGSAASVVTGLSVRGDDFVDEDGEVSTYEDALTGILQPLGIRMTQRAGKIWLYDLNGLSGAEKRQITWTHNDQVMGVDKVANNVRIKFSPYACPQLASGELDYKGKTDAAHLNLTSNDKNDPDFGNYYSYYPDYDDHSADDRWDYDLIAFTIFLKTFNAKELASIGPGCAYFKILPLVGDAGESSGVAYTFFTGGHGSLKSGFPKRKLHSSFPIPFVQGTKVHGWSSVLKTQRHRIPSLSGADASRFWIRVSQEVLFDCRYNPFEEKSKYNESSNQKKFEGASGYVFIPCRITLYDASGKALYHYKNYDIASGSAMGRLSLTRGAWVAGEDSLSGAACDCYLEYYDKSESHDAPALSGWTVNRQCIGRPDGWKGRVKFACDGSFLEMPDGQYLPYPPSGGELEVEILAGARGFAYGWVFDFEDIPTWVDDDYKIHDKLRWALYKLPKVEIVNDDVIYDLAKCDDVEYSAWINKDAKDGIDLDTVCGTTGLGANPAVRGAYLHASDGSPAEKMARAGRTACPERLLLGTLYSQYAGRMTLLSGEAAIDYGGLAAYEDEAQPSGKTFMILSQVANIREACGSTEYVEVRPDEYDELEEVE